MEKTYEDQLAWLFNQFPSYQQKGATAYKPTLENTRSLLRILGNPQDKLKFVHVAGSNGKGSTCSYLASSLTESDYKVGLFTSPHLLDFRERIRISGEMISKDYVLEFINEVQEIDLKFDPSFFEISFALALKYFSENQCDICVIETGLGGRLDATNVISPLVSIITSISLDHQNLLGDTIELIAKEKAGIIKQNTPVISSKQDKSALNQISIACDVNKAELHLIGIDEGLKQLFPILPDYQLENLSLVKETIGLLNSSGFAISERNFIDGVNHVYTNSGLTGRFQIINEKPTIIYDAAHNVDGLTKLFQHIQTLPYEEIRVVYSTSADKNIRDILNVLPKKATYYLCQFSNERGIHLDVLANEFASRDFNTITQSTPTDALNEAKKASQATDLIICTGSFFLLSDLFQNQNITA